MKKIIESFIFKQIFLAVVAIFLVAGFSYAKDGEDGVNRVHSGNVSYNAIIKFENFFNKVWQWIFGPTPHVSSPVLDGKTDRRSISVIFHDDAGAEVGRMNFYSNPNPQVAGVHTIEGIETESDIVEYKD